MRKLKFDGILEEKHSKHAENSSKSIQNILESFKNS
jgi:hypothetical protein